MDTGLLAMGTDYEVRTADYFMRAVLKPAPTCFTVEVLPPAKHGRAHSYGVRIIPVTPKAIEGLDADDQSVRSLNREYEIWRRWDDCLDFQERLEKEYERMSRDKRRGLVSGKAKRAKGIYSNPNAASSFESLPEGPDKKSISVDVHAYIPRLSRKNSFFSVSDATIQKRGEEFAAMIYSLFKADCPKLIMELRDCQEIRDFFGWWQRDKELWEKVSKKPGSAPAFDMSSRASVSETATLLTSPPSPDSPGFSMLKAKDKPIIHRPNSAMSDSTVIEKSLPSPPNSPESSRQRSKSPMPFFRPGSRQGAQGTGRPQISRPIQQIQQVQQVQPQPLRPQHPPALGVRQRNGLLSPPVEVPRARSPATMNRIGRLFDALEVEQVRTQRAQTQTDGSSDSSATPPATPTNLTYESQRERPVSTVSIDSMDSSYDIDLSFIKLPPPPPGRNRKRESIMSVSSVDSVGTTCSEDAVVPLSRRTRIVRRRPRAQPWEPDSRMSVAVPEEDEFEEYYEEDALDDSCSYLDNLDSFPGVPEDDYYMRRQQRQSFPASVCESDLYDADFPPPSPTILAPSESGHSFSSGESGSGTCAVKAKYDETIVALRIPYDTPLSALRARLVEKFAQVQGVALRPRFGLAYAPSQRLSDDAMPIILSPSPYAEHSMQDRRPSTPDSMFGGSGLARLVSIWNQDDWDLALDTCGGKLVLHILDSEVR